MEGPRGYCFNVGFKIGISSSLIIIVFGFDIYNGGSNPFIVLENGGQDV